MGNIIEKWGMFEVKIDGPKEGNPFVDQYIKGKFWNENEEKEIDGFYDGNGEYIVRFMPSFEGKYEYKIMASFEIKMADKGEFFVEKNKENNHGPVRVANTFHFAYEDGTPYFCIGTTCYVWDLQTDERINETLENLEEAGFNKIRFCVMPKHYDYNLGEPRSYPYEGKPMDSSVLNSENFWQYSGKKEGNSWDFTRFNPEHFRHIEWCIGKLQEIGVEADIIMLHPYDRWGFSDMGEEADDLYFKYLIARFGAYRNVWWSLANEYDLMTAKTIGDWERLAGIICEKDKYHHLRSIHNCGSFYDYSRPWITHCCVQRQDIYKTSECTNELREKYKKPVVLDEIAYEGNIQHGWGNITGEEMVRRFWEAACRGGYPGHGETYMNPDNILWWSHGGKLHGESAKRVKFLLSIMKEVPGIGLKPWDKAGFDEVVAVPENWALRGQYYLYYYSFMRPSFRDFNLDENDYEITVIDTWNMTKKCIGTFSGRVRVNLPAKQYMAVQIKKVN